MNLVFILDQLKLAKFGENVRFRPFMQLTDKSTTVTFSGLLCRFNDKNPKTAVSAEAFYQTCLRSDHTVLTEQPPPSVQEAPLF